MGYYRAVCALALSCSFRSHYGASAGKRERANREKDAVAEIAPREHRIRMANYGEECALVPQIKMGERGARERERERMAIPRTREAIGR